MNMKKELDWIDRMSGKIFLDLNKSQVLDFS